MKLRTKPKVCSKRWQDNPDFLCDLALRGYFVSLKQPLMSAGFYAYMYEAWQDGFKRGARHVKT